MAAHQFIYHMQGLTKTYTGGKKILDNIHLSLAGYEVYASRLKPLLEPSLR